MRTLPDGSRPKTQYFHLFDSAKAKYKPILRSAYVAQDFSHIVLQYKDYAVPVPTAGLPVGCSLATQKSGFTLKVPTWDDAAFADLHAWMTKGVYAPALPPTSQRLIFNPNPYDHDGIMFVTRTGIVNLTAGQAPILADVRMYRVAATLEIPELQRLALDRLQSVEGPTMENPVVWLEYLYFGPRILEDEETKTKREEKDKKKEKIKPKPPKLADPDLQLRGWVKAWLRKGAGSNEKKKCNLELLKDPMHWLADFRLLKTKGGALVADVDAVEWEVSRERAEKEERARSRERREEARRRERQRQWSRDRAVQAAMIASGHVVPNIHTTPYASIEQANTAFHGYPHGRVLEVDDYGRLIERGRERSRDRSGDRSRDRSRGRREQRKWMMVPLPNRQKHGNFHVYFP